MVAPLRILILEDSPTDAAVMVGLLEEAGYAIEWRRVETEADYRACLGSDLDLVLIDYTLPGFDGSRAVEILHECCADVPAIIVSGTINEATALDCIRRGAVDYLIKDRLSRLGEAVRAALAQRALRREWAVGQAALMRRTQQLEMVQLVTQEITREMDFALLLDLILRRAKELVGAEAGALYLWDEAAQALIIRTCFPHDELIREARLRLGEGLVGLVAERRQGLIINDYRHWAHARPIILERTKISGAMAEPLLCRDRLVGVIILDNGGMEHTFNEQDRQTLAPLAAQAAIAIENSRLHEAALRRGNELEALLRATRSIMSGLDLQKILERIAAEAAVIARAPCVKVLVVDKEAGQICLGALKGETACEFPAPLGTGLSGLVAATGEPVFSPDCQNDPRNVSAAADRALGITTYLGLPIKSRGEVVGILTFSTTTPRKYSTQELAYLGSFADQAAVAIENACLFETEQARRRQLEIVRRVSGEITRELDLATLLRLIINQAVSLVEGSAGVVYLWDPEQKVLVPHAWQARGDWMKDLRLRLGEGVTGLAAQERKGIVVNDYRASPHALPHLLEHVGVTASLAEPLLFGNRLLGAIVVNHIATVQQFTGEDQNLLRLFAAQAAVAIENARLHEAALRRGNELEALLRATRSIMSGQNLEEILDRILEEAAAMAGTPHVRVALVDREAQVLRAVRVRGGLVQPGVVYPLGKSLTGLVVRTGEPVVSPDVGTDLRSCFGPRYRELGIATYLGLPIKRGAEVFGALIFNTTEPRTYTSEELAYLASFADQAAIAIQQARLFDEARRSASLLEAKVEERTRELQLANLNLQEATRQAEEASRHKSEFLANMSHELRTPLNSIIGFSDLLQDPRIGPLAERQARYIAHISEAGKHLAQLIGDILDISKVEAGKLVLQPEPFPVAQALGETLVIARELANKKSQQIHVDIASVLSPLTADPVRFKQILFNLLSNAVKFTPDGGRIAVTARQVFIDTAHGGIEDIGPWGNREPEDRETGETERRRTGEQGSRAISETPAPIYRVSRSPVCGVTEWLEIRVQDTGIGIKSEDMARLFQAFVQLEVTATKHHEGTGLGLALTKRLVQLHGGLIRAESPGEGKGSTFTVLLPFGGPGKAPAASDREWIS